MNQINLELLTKVVLAVYQELVEINESHEPDCLAEKNQRLENQRSSQVCSECRLKDLSLARMARLALGMPMNPYEEEVWQCFIEKKHVTIEKNRIELFQKQSYLPYAIKKQAQTHYHTLLDWGLIVLAPTKPNPKADCTSHEKKIVYTEAKVTKMSWTAGHTLHLPKNAIITPAARDYFSKQQVQLKIEE